MSLVLAIDDVNPNRISHRGIPGAGVTKTTFFEASSDRQDTTPTAFLVRQEPGFRNSTHYHTADEFQVVVEGKGRFGRHDVSPYYVHFARAYTPYGPLRPDDTMGWAFMTLRSRYDPGAQNLPAMREKLGQISNRNPWQISEKIGLSALAAGIQEIPGLRDQQGLSICSLNMAPHSQTDAPDPSTGDGQFLLLLDGGLIYDNKEHKPYTVVYTRPGEKAFQIHATAQGLKGLVLSLPQINSDAVHRKLQVSTSGEYKKWQCELCAFAYDEILGIPEDGIGAGTRWGDVPENWICPDCSASKKDFRML